MSLNQDGVLKGWREARLTGEPGKYSVSNKRVFVEGSVWLNTGRSPHDWWHDVRASGDEVISCYFPSLPGLNLVKYLSSGQRRKIIQVLGAGG